MDWIKCEGKTKAQIMSDVIITNSVAYKDMGTHVWVAKINNRGPSLLCYATAKSDEVWYYKMITEDMGPDVYDVPQDMLDMCISRNMAWRLEVARRQESD